METNYEIQNEGEELKSSLLSISGLVSYNSLEINSTTGDFIMKTFNLTITENNDPSISLSIEAADLKTLTGKLRTEFKEASGSERFPFNLKQSEKLLTSGSLETENSIFKLEGYTGFEEDPKDGQEDSSKGQEDEDLTEDEKKRLEALKLQMELETNRVNTQNQNTQNQKASIKLAQKLFPRGRGPFGKEYFEYLETNKLARPIDIKGKGKAYLPLNLDGKVAKTMKLLARPAGASSAEIAQALGFDAGKSTASVYIAAASVDFGFSTGVTTEVDRGKVYRLTLNGQIVNEDDLAG